MIVPTPSDVTLVTTDVTTNNVSSTKHGLAPKSPADATKFLNGAATPAYATAVTSVATSGLATGGTITTTGTVTVTAAVKSDQTTATSTTVAVVPGVQQNHPSAAKFWARMTISGTTLTKQGSYNVSSVTRNGTGDYTYTFTTAFTSAEMTISGFMADTGSGGGARTVFGGANYALATGSVRFRASDGTNYFDAWTDLHLQGFGTQ